MLLAKNPTAARQIECLAISGQSLAVIPVDCNGGLLRESIPIWSDTRSSRQTNSFFQRVDREHWYMTTGNGFPPECYSVFKIMWYRDNEPGLLSRTCVVLGSKDWVNFRLHRKDIYRFLLRVWQWRLRTSQLEVLARSHQRKRTFRIAFPRDSALDSDYRDTHVRGCGCAPIAAEREGSLRRGRQFMYGAGSAKYR